MDLLKLKNKKIIILGHRNTDIDSIVSGTLLSLLMDYLGIHNEFIILDKNIDSFAMQLASKYGIPINKKRKVLKNKNLFLVDHIESYKGNNIVGIIDHHPKNIEEIREELIIDVKSSSCSKLVYDLMVEYEYPIFEKIIKWVVLSMYVDTCSFKSTKALKKDIAWSELMINRYNFNKQELYEEGLCVTDMSMGIEKVIKNGYKKFVFNKTICSSYIQINEQSFYPVPYIRAIQRKLAETGDYMWDFIVVNFYDDTTLEYRVKEYEWCLIKYDKILVRSTDIIPNIKQKYNLK